MLYNILSRDLQSNIKSYIDFNSDEVKSFVNALETAWLLGHNELSLPYWSDKIGSTTLTNLTFGLAQAGWITTKVLSKYASISLREDTLSYYINLESYRTANKFKRYKLTKVEEVQPSDLTKTPSGVKPTGLDRPGFAQCANENFSFDTQYILKYYDTIKANLIKSMVKMSVKYPDILDDKANYQAISEEILDYHMCNPTDKFNMEANLSDQRGRAIYLGLKKVFNPVASKDARSMLVVDKPVVITYDNSSALNDIYLFIAELIGTKATTWTGKMTAGRNYYRGKTLPTMSDKHLHEIIWLERMYDKLDTIFIDGKVLWDIPLELDAQASLAQIAGILLNDKRLLAKTNVIGKNDLQDFWFVDGVPNRPAIKSIGTPTFYGSNQSFKKLLASKDETLTVKEMKLIKHEFNTGAYSVIKLFKDLLNKYSNIATPEYVVNTGYESFITAVNKHKAVASNLQAYTAYDTTKDRFKIVMNHSVVRIPDYNRFKAYATTGLFHNLDSRLMDNTMQTIHARGEWAIAIHDAGLVLPGTYMRTAYTAELEDLRANRHTVIDKYRVSIGCVGRTADIAFAKLMTNTEQLDSSVPFEESALK